MKHLLILIFSLFASLSVFSQNVLERKISGGLIFSGMMLYGDLSTKEINSDLGTGSFETENLPIFGVGFFIEYHHNNHNFGFRQQTALHPWEYGSIYNDSIDEDYNYVYSEGFTDYTEYKFNNFFAYYGYSFTISNFQPTLKMAVGYHNVHLSGYASYHYYDALAGGASFYEEYEDQETINYWSLKPEIEGEFRFSKHMSAFVILGYDFALSTNQDYSYEYDNALIDKGYVNEILRSFTPANYFELSLGMAFSF